YHPELKIYRAQMQPLSLDQAGKLIETPSTALLEFVVTEDVTHLFVLTKQKPLRAGGDAPVLTVYTLNVKQKDLAYRVEEVRRRLGSLDLGFQEQARELYVLVLGPARAMLQNKTDLIIVPDGVLWELPFQALQSGPEHYLIESSSVSYAPSFTVLLEMSKP